MLGVVEAFPRCLLTVYIILTAYIPELPQRYRLYAQYLFYLSLCLYHISLLWRLCYQHQIYLVLNYQFLSYFSLSVLIILSVLYYYLYHHCIISYFDSFLSSLP